MSKILAIAALAAVSAAEEPKLMQQWRAYEAPKLRTHHPKAGQIHERGFKAQEKMKRKLHNHGYPTSKAEHKAMEAEGTLHPRLMNAKLQKNGDNNGKKDKSTALADDWFQFQLGFSTGI